MKEYEVTYTITVGMMALVRANNAKEAIAKVREGGHPDVLFDEGCDEPCVRRTAKGFNAKRVGSDE